MPLMFLRPMLMKNCGLPGSTIFDQLSDPQGASLENRIAYAYSIRSALDPEWLQGFRAQVGKNLQGLDSLHAPVSSNLAPFMVQFQQVMDEALEPIRYAMKKMSSVDTAREEAEDGRSG